MDYDPLNPPPEGIPANPLSKVEGDSAETDRWDDNDTPPETPPSNTAGPSMDELDRVLDSGSR